MMRAPWRSVAIPRAELATQRHARRWPASSRTPRSQAIPAAARNERPVRQKARAPVRCETYGAPLPRPATKLAIRTVPAAMDVSECAEAATPPQPILANGWPAGLRHCDRKPHHARVALPSIRWIDRVRQPIHHPTDARVEAADESIPDRVRPGGTTQRPANLPLVDAPRSTHRVK